MEQDANPIVSGDVEAAIAEAAPLSLDKSALSVARYADPRGVRLTWRTLPAEGDGPTLLNRPFNDPYIDAMSKHWNLSQEQEVAAARLTRDAVEMLTAAAERGGLEIGERGPRFVQRLIDAHFLELEPGVHGRAVVRITENGRSALLFKRHSPKPR